MNRQTRQLALQAGIKIVSGRGWTSDLERKTFHHYVTKNGTSYCDFDAALQHADDPTYIPKPNEPQSTHVIVEHSPTIIRIVKNSGWFDFTNYKYVKTVSNMEEWVAA